MSFKLNIITLGLLAATSGVSAADFSVHKANLQGLKLDAYQCKSCIGEKRYQAELQLSAGWAENDDIHAGNAFGDASDGLRAAMDADVGYRNAGYEANVQAYQLGLENSYAHLDAGRSGQYALNLDYQLLTRYDSRAQTQLWHNNGLLLPDTATRDVDLQLEREKVGLGLAAQYGVMQAFINYDHEQKTGNRRSSLVTPRPVNFALPVDANTENLNAGLNISGENWLSELAYHGSFYRNNIDNLSLPYLPDVYAATPDNDAHQVSLSGQYMLGRGNVNGRVAAGRMLQDGDLIQVSGNPLQSWDGQVDTLDARIGFSNMLSPRWRVNGQVDYSERDNKSSVWEFAQLEFDNVSGAFKQNVPMDIERLTYKLHSSYRFNSEYRLMGGYDRKEVERSYLEREQTHDDAFWAKLNIRSLANTVIDFGGRYENRSGSVYNAVENTSIEENSLLRKFYLADRERQAVDLKVNYVLLSWLTIDLNGYYAKDDYAKTIIGLTESTDYGYDLQLGMQLSEQLHLYASASQQWIDSAIAGSQSFSSPDWYNDVADEFINLGAGFTYSGLFDDRLTLGGNYQFSNSASDILVTYNEVLPYGDYYSYNHSVELYGRYALSERMGLKLSYQYERYYDTDYSQSAVNSIPGLITLGDLNHNYNAHLLMFTFSYLLP